MKDIGEGNTEAEHIAATEQLEKVLNQIAQEKNVDPNRVIVTARILPDETTLPFPKEAKDAISDAFQTSMDITIVSISKKGCSIEVNPSEDSDWSNGMDMDTLISPRGIEYNNRVFFNFKKGSYKISRYLDRTNDAPQLEVSHTFTPSVTVAIAETLSSLVIRENTIIR